MKLGEPSAGVIVGALFRAMDGTEPYDAVLLIYPGGTPVSRVAQPIDQRSVNAENPLLPERRGRCYSPQLIQPGIIKPLRRYAGAAACMSSTSWAVSSSQRVSSAAVGASS
jgi:hypothetical protein